MWVHAFKPDGLGSYDMGVFQVSMAILLARHTL